jgi:hypothetical protein
MSRKGKTISPKNTSFFFRESGLEHSVNRRGQQSGAWCSAEVLSVSRNQRRVIMATKSRINRSQSQAADASLSTGLVKHEPTLASFVIAGATVKTTDLITILQNRQNSAKAVESTRAIWQAAVAANRSLRAQSNATVSGVKQALHVMFAGSPDTLADFGLTPHKPYVVLPAVKVASAAKAKATRTARHTLGAKQKAGIKGVLDGVNLVVTTQPSAPSAPSTTPASPTPTVPAAGSGSGGAVTTVSSK